MVFLQKKENTMKRKVQMLKKGILIGCLLTVAISNAQITKASLSPRIKIEQQIGLATLNLDYGRPSKNDRPIFGDLIPYGKVWRTGANSSTKISFDKEISLAGNKIAAGNYALYTIPGKKKWTIIIHKNTKLWGAGSYDAKDDLMRFEVEATTQKESKESFEIYADNFHANGGDLIISWDKTKIVLPIFVDSDALTFQEIEDKLITNPSADTKAATYFDAAQFYYHKGKDFEKAKKWFDKAIELRPKAFWYVYYRAELAYTQKDIKTAKKLAEQSLKMAKESPSGDYGYIAKNELLLKKL